MKRGGVAIYVNDSISFKSIGTIYVSGDWWHLENVMVELWINKKYNIIVSSIYGTPGTNVDMFFINLNWLSKALRILIKQYSFVWILI